MIIRKETGRRKKLAASVSKFLGMEVIPIFDWLQDALDTNFEVVRILKEGPRSSVRLIRHVATGKRFILRRFQGSGEVYQRLLSCSSPNLPMIFEAASQGERNLVVEEFVEGDTLSFLLKDALFQPWEVRKTARQLCQALWVLHSMAAVHRDVKPENVILRGKDVVLIDFDAARIHNPDQNSDTQILGTVGFAAPEQYGLSQSDVRTDIYAMGILINIMLTGEHPSKQLAEGSLGRVVGRCTHVNPQKRYKNVLRLMDAL
ncbi:protein kinase [Pseudoflavonifractor sp. 524-17]|uniref:protein kinase domain-containing protein n=1 Tax=Pseudoflavonifractor sp. 524-17 TaxID=2304577 RepID=UPI001FADF2B6|nr:protein kinase [Pseudoflavonifractor sp. 524-17]